MKKVAVFATDKRFAEFLMNNVKKYMHRYADFAAYSIHEIEDRDYIDEDMILLSAFTIYKKVCDKISNQSNIIILSLTLNRHQINALKEIPEGTRALLVNFDNRSCMHTMTCIYEAGIRGLELYPYFGEGSYDETIQVAITPDEAQLVPEGIAKVYDIGQSSVDMSSLYNIAEKLEVYEEFLANEAKEAKNDCLWMNSSVDRLLSENESMNDKIYTLLQLMNEGIIISDSIGKIYMANDKASRFLSKRTQVLLGFNISDILPELDLNSTKDKLIKMQDMNLVASAVEIRSRDEVAGHIITLNDFEEEEDKQHGIRAKLSETRHMASYHFDDILGNSKIIRDTVEEARKLAKSESAVMIIGESGTGKEMFAQSIHNASNRKKYNFVAVNCAAIPDNLLESEMFGYEEGSFTGARKGGKMGLFELAHRGTIFLDEIGEMPLQLQSKLLRVLEEKKIMRVGSNKNISIDVRIISATNKNLYAMVERGEFREDLFYRLNVLPLNIPALRERNEDIPILFEAMARKMNVRMTLSSAAADALKCHGWRGNVRELRNITEFLASKGKSYIDESDLPKLNHSHPQTKSAVKKENATLIDKFFLNEGRDLDLYYRVLLQMKVSNEHGERFGRQKLMMYINQNETVYTEGEVRKALTKLSSYGFIRSARGRGGSLITSDGAALLAALEKFRETGSLTLSEMK